MDIIIQGLLLAVCFSILPSSVHSIDATLTVDTGSCIETSPGVYLNPGDNVILNCNVTNPSALNFLVWNVPIGGESQLILSSGNPSDSNSLFSATVISADNDAKTVSSQLMFTVSETLDEMKVACANNENPQSEDNCTLLVTTIPSPPEPLPPNCTDIRNDSLTLQWSLPSDNGGGDESIMGYSIIGTPDNISISDVTNTMDTIPNLTPNTIYTFNVRARNSLGFGDDLVIICTTLGNVPPGFTEVSVCLDVNMDFDTVLDIEYDPCPINFDPVTIPPVDNYTVTVINNSAMNMISVLSENITIDTCDYTTPVSEDNIPGVYTVEMSVNNIIGSTKTTSDPFIASWLRDVQVKDVTNTSAIIQYTTADCIVKEIENLTIELIITGDNSSIVNPSSPVLYENATMGIFNLTNLEPNNVVTYTVQVIVEVMGSDINIGRIHTGSFTVSPTPPSSTSTTMSIDMSSSFTSESPSIMPTSSAETVVFPIAPVAGGVVGGIVFILLIVIIIIVIIIIWYRNKKHSGKDRDESDIPLNERKNPETGQDQVEHEQAPTGDLYALPDKKGSRRQPPSAPKETPTYQDPDTIKRQQAPTGDLYALPEKKPLYSQVNKENKTQEAMYADLGFQDHHPPTSPPLISPPPQDTTMVLYSEVQQRQQQ